MTRILIIEDEPTIAIALQDDLELEGYEVDVAEDGEAGAARALDREHDLILLDLMLPKKDGLTVCREVRAAGIDTPIIVLTAKGQEIDKVLGLELGADDYVTKPFSPRELVARIKAVLRRADGQVTPASEELPAPSEFGDFKVDFAGCRAWRNGDEVALTALEFRLLRVFLTHRGKMLSIDELIAQVWGNDVFLSNRVVYTHVNNLRGKIEADPSHPRHLITVRGMGYRFDERAGEVLNEA